MLEVEFWGSGYVSSGNMIGSFYGYSDQCFYIECSDGGYQKATADDAESNE